MLDTEDDFRRFLFSAVSVVRDALHDDEYRELKESRLGVFLKFKELNFDPVRFSLIEFEQLTGLNYEYIGNLENPRCEITKEMTSFCERIGVSVDVDPRRKYLTATRASLARLVMDLEKFENYPWGRVEFKVLMNSLRAKNFTKSYTVDGFIQVLQVWIYHALPELGANYGNPIPNNTSPPLLAFKDAGINPWTNPKTNVVYVNEESSVKSLVVREEDIKRPSKKARIEAPAKLRWEDILEARSGAIPEARSGAIPEARSEASIHELKEKATEVLEKALVKAKETKLKEAKKAKETKEAKAKEVNAKEAKEKATKEKEAKEKEAKEKEAKEKETKEKEAKKKEEKEAWLGEAKEAKEAKEKVAKATKTSPCADTVLSTEPEVSAEANDVLMDKDKNTVSDVQMQEARRLSKKDSALAVVRGRNERDRKLVASQQSSFQGNSTTKVIIPNTKVGHGYDPFALSDKQLSKALTEYLKKDP
ncbi:hypothetical protein N665_0070s0012 [Sinapis alba]|nr:hypothetical protein N665_0070s0012 [Sinapis alba]